MSNAATKTFSETDAAKLLGTNVAGFRSRMVALGLTKVCGRCGGSGSYSYNSMDGDRCYGCSGKGKVLLPVTKKLAVDMKRRQDAGELDAYFARNRARNAARASIAPLFAEVVALAKPIGDAYEAEYQRKYGGRLTWEEQQKVTMDPVVVLAQGMATAIHYGLGHKGIAPSGIRAMGASEIEWEVQRGRADYEIAAAEMAERVEMMKALRAAFDAR